MNTRPKSPFVKGQKVVLNQHAAHPGLRGVVTRTEWDKEVQMYMVNFLWSNRWGEKIEVSVWEFKCDLVE